MHLAALVDRDIFADDEAFVREMITDFVGQIGFAVIVESPTAARPMNQSSIRSVRHRARRFMTTFSLYTSGSPQHETDNDAEREGGYHRCNRAFRDHCLDMVFLLAQGLAEFG